MISKYAKLPEAGSLHAAQLTLFRFLFAVLTIPLLYRMQSESLRGRAVGGLIWRGVFGVGAVYLSTSAIVGQNSSAGVTALLNSTNVIFAPIFAWLFLSERITIRSWVAILITAVGLCLLESHALGTLVLGHVFALVSGVLAGAAVTMVRKLRTGPNPERPETIVFYYSIIGIPIAALLSLGEPWMSPTPTGWILVFLNGIAALGAQWFMAYGLRVKDTVAGVLLLNLQTVIVATIGWMQFKEHYSWDTIVGALIIMAAAIWLSVPRQTQLEQKTA